MDFACAARVVGMTQTSGSEVDSEYYSKASTGRASKVFVEDDVLKL